jgi:hypothetical protein
MALELLVFRPFSLSACLYLFDIWCIVLPYQVKDQVLIHWFSIIKFPHFSLSLSLLADIYEFDIWYINCFAIPGYRSIKWKFGPLIFRKVMVLGFRKFQRFLVFRSFFLCACRYPSDISVRCFAIPSYISVQIWFWAIDFSKSYDPWDWK